MSIESNLTAAERIAKAASAAIGAYAPLALMGIDGVKWLVNKLKTKGVLTPAEVAEYEASMAEWQANIDRAQANVDRRVARTGQCKPA